MGIVSNLRRRKMEAAMMRKMLSSLRKRVKRMIIKTDATFARKLAVSCAVTGALRSHISHASASRSHPKGTGIALIV
jgi:hypothetical protein